MDSRRTLIDITVSDTDVDDHGLKNFNDFYMVLPKIHLIKLEQEDVKFSPLSAKHTEAAEWVQKNADGPYIIDRVIWRTVRKLR